MDKEEKTESNVVSLFWFKYAKAVAPVAPKKTTDQKIAEALAKHGSHGKTPPKNPA